VKLLRPCGHPGADLWRSIRGAAFIPLFVVALLTWGSPYPARAQQTASTSPEEVEEPQPLAQQRQAFHIISPNDSLTVNLYAGGQLQSFTTVVDAAGEVSLPEIGHVVLSGLRIDEATRLLEERFAEYFRNPYVDITLSSFGLIEVLVTGPMHGSQVLLLQSNATLYDLLKQVMGSQLRVRTVYLIHGQQELFGRLRSLAPPVVALEPGATSSEGGLVAQDTVALSSDYGWLDALVRSGQGVDRVSTVGLLRNGRLSELNRPLHQNDVVYFPAPQMLVEIEGATLSGVYEVFEGETLADLLALSGYSNDPEMDLRNVTVERYDDNRLRRIAVNLSPAASPEGNNIVLHDRDVVRIVPRIAQVFVLGEVKTPGVVDYNPIWKVTDYLSAAGGMTPQAHPRFISVIRQPRSLTQPELATQFTKLDLELLKRPDLLADVLLEPGDVIYVPPKGIEVNIGTITSALNTVFLGLNFFDNLNDNSSNSDDGNGTTNERTTSVGR
jgi:protein involved in polysaccharide export with SLBB domain